MGVLSEGGKGPGKWLYVFEGSQLVGMLDGSSSASLGCWEGCYGGNISTPSLDNTMAAAVEITHLPPEVLEADIQLMLPTGRFQFTAVVICQKKSEGAPLNSFLPSL